MAQSEATVTVVSPTPPTNLLCVYGGSPPTTDGLAFTDDGTAGAVNTATAPTNGTPHECAGTIVTVTATVPNPSPAGQLVTISTLGNMTLKPNEDHASQKAPATPPTITGLAPNNLANAGGGTTKLTVTGTGFKPSSIVSVGGIPQNTQYNSVTSLVVNNAPKRTSAGTSPVIVTTGGTATGATNWTFT
jgi:hypothetical protein